MSSYGKVGTSVLFFVLISISAPPISRAQSGPYMGALQLNSPGGYLGIQMDDVTAANMSKFKLSSERGVIVRSVEKDTPAEKASLREDDVILEFAGIQVWSSAQFSRLVQETPPGRKVDLVVSRDGKRVTLSAEIGERGGRTTNNRMNQRGAEDFFYRFFPAPGNRDNPGVLIAPVGKPRLGLTLQPLSEQLAEYMGIPGKKGALVSSVLEGSPSAGKIRAGDVIIAADGKEIREPEELTKIVRDKSEGKMTLKVVRDKKEITVEVTLPADSPAGGEGRGLRL